MTTARKPDYFGRRLVRPGGYVFEVTAKHAQWLDFLENELDAVHRLRVQLAECRNEIARLSQLAGE